MHALAGLLTNNTATFHVQHHNDFEWPALHALWEHATATLTIGELLVYAHNKGVTHVDDVSGARPGQIDRPVSEGYGFRTLHEMTIFRQMLGAWPWIVAVSSILPAPSSISHWCHQLTALAISTSGGRRPPGSASIASPRRRTRRPNFERPYYEFWLGAVGLPDQPPTALPAKPATPSTAASSGTA